MPADNEDVEARATPPRPPPGPLELYLGWGKVGLMGFGGVTPWARRVVVEERHWLDDADYAALLGIGQVLPGPNTPNVCIMLGQRFCGLPGAIASIVGLMTVPMISVLLIATAYDRLAGSMLARVAVGAAAAAAAGLVISTGVKMARGARLSIAQMAICAAVIASVGFFRVPLVWALVTLGPISVALAHFGRKP